MLIWISVALPLIAAAVLYWKFQHKITCWELLIMVAVPIGLTAASKGLIETVQVQDTEYWGSWVTVAQYRERWDEEVPCRHEIPCSHPEYSTDSDGKRYRSGWKHSNDGHYHSYDVDDHPPEWHAISSLGRDFRITQAEFERLANQFGNREFVNLRRRQGMYGYHRINGNRYDATWRGERPKLEPVTTVHSYENRIKASSHSILKFRPVDGERAKRLYAHPEVHGYGQKCVLGAAGPTTAGGEKKLMGINAALGSAKQIRVYVLVFRNEPVEAAVDQESHWNGGNKNEFDVCIGVDDAYEVQWAYVFSWSQSETLKVEAKSFLESQKTLDLEKFAEWLEPAVLEGWTRRSFAEFDYLTVDPPTWAVVATVLVTLAASLGVAFWSVKNEFESTLSREPVKLFSGGLPWER